MTCPSRTVDKHVIVAEQFVQLPRYYMNMLSSPSSSPSPPPPSMSSSSSSSSLHTHLHCSWWRGCDVVISPSSLSSSSSSSSSPLTSIIVANEALVGGRAGRLAQIHSLLCLHALSTQRAVAVAVPAEKLCKRITAYDVTNSSVTVQAQTFRDKITSQDTTNRSVGASAAKVCNTSHVSEHHQ